MAALGGKARPVEVAVGITDGIKTEVSGGELREGFEVVAGDETEDSESEPASDGGQTRSPFMPPKPPKGARMGPPPM